MERRELLDAGHLDEIRRREAIDRLERELERDAKRMGNGRDSSSERLLAMAARRLGAPSYSPLRGVDPMAGSSLDQARMSKAEAWLSLYRARMKGEIHAEMKAQARVQAAIAFEAELLGAMPSRSASQTNVQVNVTTGERLEAIRRRIVEAGADPVLEATLTEAYEPERKATEGETDPTRSAQEATDGESPAVGMPERRDGA